MPNVTTITRQHRAVAAAQRKRHKDRLHSKAKVFTRYLTTTLIPDLKESGRDFTARDFEEAVLLIQDLMGAR